jgi:MinD superfamily P-loop ATPase
MKMVVVAINKGGAGKTMLAKSMARVASWQVALCDDCG